MRALPPRTTTQPAAYRVQRRVAIGELHDTVRLASTRHLPGCGIHTNEGGALTKGIIFGILVVILGLFVAFPSPRESCVSLHVFIRDDGFSDDS